MIALVGILLFHSHPVCAQPSAAQVLSDMGWSASDQQRVLNGEFVTTDAAGTSDKDLALSIAFLVKTSPADLSEQIIAGNILASDPQVQASGEFSSAGSLADLARLQVGTEPLQTFLNARPGEALNLSAVEIAAFNALQGAGPQAALPQLRKMLLDRFQAYKTSAWQESRRMIGAARRPTSPRSCAKPRCAQVLKIRPLSSDVDGPSARHRPRHATSLPLGALQHRRRHDGADALITATDGGTRGGPAPVLRQRWLQQRTSRGGFLPVGGTIVAYTSHTFTDQVAGFGGGVKRDIGRRMMASKLTQMFEAARNRIDKP
jgi:hypothetical protein